MTRPRRSPNQPRAQGPVLSRRPRTPRVGPKGVTEAEDADVAGAAPWRVWWDTHHPIGGQERERVRGFARHALFPGLHGRPSPTRSRGRGGAGAGRPLLPAGQARRVPGPERAWGAPWWRSLTDAGFGLEGPGSQGSSASTRGRREGQVKQRVVQPGQGIRTQAILGEILGR